MVCSGRHEGDVLSAPEVLESKIEKSLKLYHFGLENVDLENMKVSRMGMALIPYEST